MVQEVIRELLVYAKISLVKDDRPSNFTFLLYYVTILLSRLDVFVVCMYVSTDLQ